MKQTKKKLLSILSMLPFLSVTFWWVISEFVWMATLTVLGFVVLFSTLYVLFLKGVLNLLD